MQEQRETLTQKARRHFKSKEYAKTISCCDQALRTDPRDCAMLQLRGTAQQTLGNYSAAINDFNEILKLEPNNTFTKDLLAKALDLQRYIATPFTEQEKHEQLVLKRAGEARQKAEAEQQKRLLEQQRVADAQRLQQQAAARTAEQLKRLKEQAKLHYNNKKYTDTVSCCNQILQADPNNISMRELRGAAKFRLEQYREAIQDLERPSARALRFRGAAKKELGLYHEAIIDLEKAIELKPGNDFAKKYLEEARELQEQLKPVVVVDTSLQDTVRETVDTLRAIHAELAELMEQMKPLKEMKDPFSEFLMSRDSAVISRKQLAFGEEVGRGTFGIVYKGEWTYKDPFKTTIAIKQLKSDVDVEGFKKEIEIHSTLNFYSVVRVYGVVLEKAGQPMCMIMEYMELGSLRDVLDVYKDKPESERLAWSIRLSIAKDIAKGIAFLHAQNPPLIHRDIKSLNILLDGQFRAKVSDFGLAKLITDVTESNYAKGTSRWMAPELFGLTAEYTTASDVFGLAMVFWELASFVLPYKETMGDKLRIKSGVEKGERETFGERTPNTPKEYRELVESGWDHEPQKRPSAEKVVVKLDAIFAKYSLVPTMFSAPKGNGDYIDNTPVLSLSNSSYMGNSYK